MLSNYSWLGLGDHRSLGVEARLAVYQTSTLPTVPSLQPQTGRNSLSKTFLPSRAKQLEEHISFQSSQTQMLGIYILPYSLKTQKRFRITHPQSPLLLPSELSL